MHLATATAANTAPSDTTTMIVIAVAGVMTVVLGTWIVVSLRRNQRLARSMGGFTPTESKLNRSHGVALVAVLVISMGLAVGSAVSAPVRDALAAVGENSRWLTLAAIPVALVYGRWMRKRVGAALAERAQLGR
jgi:heme/copper-type cytochrome/quinol oxidase subunit 2